MSSSDPTPGGTSRPRTDTPSADDHQYETKKGCLTMLGLLLAATILVVGVIALAGYFKML